MDSVVDSVPEAFWNMFPPSYDTPESIIKLRDEAELGKAFDFV